ncbi:MAG TPA: hypothetical protein VGX25_33160 [Actinophytocola sp.]|uniref:hypothetical protein n=1 Tax=Actinophytocola sp. TaxID=1872138 RepID=UPI002DDD82CB|nr:hypothetical protein [Actinophytocola sp.]HEV2784261.1 hypothetical protein [Actinophytocola sp.]
MSLSEPGLDRNEADRALKRLGEECDRIAEALLAMDNHPGHQLLRGAALTGVSRQRWAEVSTAMATLWEQFEAYRTLVERAREVRGRRSRPGQPELDELTELLTGPVVELNQEQVPIEQRSLTGPALNVERISLAELVTRMKATYAKVTAVLAEADTASATALRRLDPLESQLRSAMALAEPLGPEQLADLARVRDRIAEVRRLAVSDPLAIGSDPLRAAEAELATITKRLAELSTAKDTFDQRLARIDDVLSDIERTQQRARAVSAEALAKIAATGLPELVDLVPPLRDRVSRLSALRRGGDWQRLTAELDRLEQAAADARAEANGQLAAFAGLLDRRAELRGRLDAYRAKAERLGRAEDLELTALHRDAHDLLHTAPCDLAAATRAVNRYQQAVRQEAAR